jgi:hypothetical protein
VIPRREIITFKVNAHLDERLITLEEVQKAIDLI